MFFFDKLSVLSQHSNFLSNIIKKGDFFLVGGCVRDIILGLTDNPTDIDLTMAGNPKKIYSTIQKKNLSSFMTEKFGTITLLPKTGTYKNTKYELTPLRTEGAYDDYRHPEEITWSDNILDDAKRRDFTINCLYYFAYQADTITQKAISTKSHTQGDTTAFIGLLDKQGIVYDSDNNVCIIQNHDLIAKFFAKGIFNQKARLAYTDFIDTTFSRGDKKKKATCIQFILDPYKGIQDIYTKRLQAVGDPDARFNEDALRLLRAVRFVNVVNHKLTDTHQTHKVSTFDFETKTWLSLKKNFFLIQFVAKERVKEELVKIFTHGNPFGAIALFDELHILKWIFPALYANKHIDQPVRYHPFDVYTHTLLTLKYLQEINTDYLTRLGMLYHDVGKVDQYYTHSLPLDREEIRKTFGTRLNHINSGVDHAAKDFGNLGFSRKEIETIQRYVANHQKPGEILMAHPDKREKKLRILLSEGGYERVSNVLDITIADRRGQMNPLQNSSDISDVLVLKDMLDKLNTQEGQFTMKQLKINGNDLMKTYNIKPGPLLGEVLEKIFVWVRDDIAKRNNKKSILLFAKKILS